MGKAEDAERRLRALYDFERQLAAGRVVAGTDEAGAGPLAGPVVAAAVILPADPIPGIDDSKQLSEKKREELYLTIKERAVAYAVVEVSADEIDRLNILQACLKGMSEAVKALSTKPDFVLTDARKLPNLGIAHEAIVKGDARCASIAAASILAKVHRDHLMIALDQEYPGYGFAKHKGYGTEEHIKALAALGPSIVHRKSFAPVNNKQLTFGF
ncbi:MAG: ribonuclease HII [Deltaproteobacteria bacterium]|nr:ribonuclease HII [Deltaproteobacteria bacterium]